MTSTRANAGASVSGRLLSYYFSLQSPWSYIGHGLLTQIVARHGLRLVYRPMPLSQVFPNSGGLPLPKRHPLRQRYRRLELQRWRDARGLSFHLDPAFWPFDASLADRMIIALADLGQDVEAVLPRAYAAVWEDEQNLADPAVLAGLLAAAGLAPEPVLAAARDTERERLYAENAEAALAAGVFGAPSYVLDGEVFWGQDRLELLDAALTSGRRPYSAEVR